MCVLFIVSLMSLTPLPSLIPVSRDSKRNLKLVAKQVVGLALAFPTAGMSLVLNLTSIDEYHRDSHPELYDK